MHSSLGFAAFALAFATTSKAQAFTSTPGSTVKIVDQYFQSSCWGSLPSEVGAEVILDPCSELTFHTFTLLEGNSTNTNLGYKFQLVGPTNPTMCMSASGATDAVPMQFDTCADDDVMQLFLYSQPDNQIMPLSDTGSCLTNNKASATLAACAPLDSYKNTVQQWLILPA